MKRVYNGNPRFAKRASYGVNQAYNILNHFGKPTVRAWANGDPSGSAIASQLADIDFDGSVAKALREAIGYQAKARLNTNRKNAMNHTRRRANRKSTKIAFYFSAFNRSGDVVDITAEPHRDGYIWSYQGPNVEDQAQLEMSLPLPEAYDLFLSTFGLTKGDFWGPEVYTYASHRANRKNTMNHTSRRANHKRAYFGGEMDWENITDEGDPIYGSSGEGLDGFYYSFYVYADEVNLVFEAQNEDTMDPKEVWTYEHGGDIPSGEYLAALGDAMAVDFVRTGGVSNPIGNVFRRANRKRAKLDLYFSAFNKSGDMVEITAKPYGNGYIWSYQGPDYNDYDKALISLPLEESYNLFLEEMDLTQGDFWGPELYTHTANRRANRKTASEELALVVFDQSGGDLYEEVSDDLDAGDYEKVVDYMSQWDYGEYHDFESESYLESVGYVVDMGHYVLSYTHTRAPFVALYVKTGDHRANRRANLKVSYSKEDEFEVHDEVVEKFPGGESALADLFGYTNLDQAEINSAKVMPYIEDAVFSRGGDQDDVDFAYDNLEYYFQTEY